MSDRESTEETSPQAPPKPDEGQKTFLPVVLLATLGLALSLALEYVHAHTHLVPTEGSFCAVGETFDCTVVAASSTSVFLGLPWAIWGALGFSAILVAAIKRSVWLLPLAAVAALVSITLLIVSFVHIGSLCFLCEAVHATALLLFWFVWMKRRELVGSHGDTDTILSIFAFPTGAAIALFFVLPPYWGSFTYKGEPPFATGVTEGGHPWIGAENPSVVIEEFTDYRCPHCKISSARTLRLLAKNGDYRLIRRQQPRMKCPEGRDSACRASRLAYCAGKQDKFWRADRWLFSVPEPRKSIPIERMIDDLDLDDRALKACFSSKEAFDFTHAEYMDAKKAKVIEVPSYRVDGKLYTAAEFARLVH